MINKQRLWFLTLFSLILVLSIYYVTMPNELLLTTNSNYNTEKATVETKENDTLTAMRVNLDEERQVKIEDLKKQMNDSKITSEEKNQAYEQIKYLTQLSSYEAELEKKIKETYKLDNFIKVDKTNIDVTILSKKHNTNLANNVMRLIQNSYKERMNITVKFE